MKTNDGNPQRTRSLSATQGRGNVFENTRTLALIWEYVYCKATEQITKAI